MLNCKIITTPMNTNEKLCLGDSLRKANPTCYRRIVGSLLYLTHTRPDLVYDVGIVSQFMQSPIMHQFGAVKRILHYVSGTLDHSLLYKHTNVLCLSGLTDSDCGGSPDNKRSTTGWCFSLGLATIAWCSKKQLISVLSSTEAEYILATSTTYEAV